MSIIQPIADFFTGKDRKKERAQRQAQDEAAVTASRGAGPSEEDATGKAKKDSQAKRRRRARTLISGPRGVLESGTPAKKTLFGE